MAEVRNSQSNVEVFDNTTRNRTVTETGAESPAVGVYDEPATSPSPAGGALRLVLYLAAILLLVYLLFQWVT